MSAREVFYAGDGLLRPPWRILVFCVASLLSLIVAGALVGPVISSVLAAIGVTGVADASWVEAAGLLAGTAVTLRLVDKRPWRDVWLGQDAARPRLWLIGFAIGALAIGVPIILLLGARWLRETGAPPGSWWGAAVRVTLLLLPAALVEELTTRGYILSVLRGWWGWPWAIAGTSIAFGLLHLANNGVSAESVGLVMLAGVFLAGVLYATRSLYAAWMAHFAWNWMMAVVFHTAVSGFPMESPRYRYVDAGPDWATGGVWGPEGGVPAGVGMIVGIAYLYRRRASAPSDVHREGDA